MTCIAEIGFVLAKKVKNKLMFKILLTIIITNRRKFMKSQLRSLLCAVGRTGFLCGDIETNI